MNRKLKQLLKQSFIPLPTKHKVEFINSISYPKAKLSEVLLAQFGFIRKRVWLFYALGVCLAYFYTNVINIPQSIVAVISAILPFFSIYVITEIQRNTACNMAEVELACKYNLQKITLMRLIILGTVSFVMLVLFVILASKNDFGALRNTIYISVPYLLSTYISLGIISRFSFKETNYACAAVCCGISAFMIIVNNFYQFIYNIRFLNLWVVTFVVLIILTIISLLQFAKSKEELQWSLL